MPFPLLAAALALAPAPPAGFRPAPFFAEVVRERDPGPGARARMVAPERVDPLKPTTLVVYAAPNGNTLEQTLGRAPAPGVDWHFGIQHAAAQCRRVRELRPGENVAFACVEADGLSWPAWTRATPDAPAKALALLEALRGWLPGSPRVVLAGHSGGGSLLFALLDAGEPPPWLDHLLFLDANYNFADRHGDRLLSWLRGAPTRRLTVLAYDDRNVTLNGKPVVGPDGGTWRATERTAARFAREDTLTTSANGPFATRSALGGRAALHVHPNPDNRILHAALVGEMNGLLAPLAEPAALGGPPAYLRWVEPAPVIPPRPANARGGAAILAEAEALPPAARDALFARELLAGNLPDFLRTFHPVELRDGDRSGTVHVMPDYLAVGGNDDWVRVPLTPMSAARVAEAFGCTLPTRKVVDATWRAADEKLAPVPLTEARESVAAFLRHHRLIEAQRSGRPSGAVVAGVKKDVVLSARLAEKPGRVAIFGWHRPDGSPIQPLSIVHGERYVDYSHGVRLMRREVTVGGKPRDAVRLLRDPATAGLLSDEGAVTGGY